MTDSVLDLLPGEGKAPAGAAAAGIVRPPTESQPTVEPRTYVAYGKPAPQGSKTRNKFGGVRDDNAERLEPWRNAVMGAVFDNQPPARLEGPVACDLTFVFDKPKSAPKTKAVWPVTRSTFDADKLTRAVFDALTAAGVWRDDSQVVEFTARKAFASPALLPIPGAIITVWPVV